MVWGQQALRHSTDDPVLEVLPVNLLIVEFIVTTTSGNASRLLNCHHLLDDCLLLVVLWTRWQCEALCCYVCNETSISRCEDVAVSERLKLC